MKSNKFWIALLGAVIVISAVAAFMLRQGQADIALIYQDGQLIQSIDLSAVTEPYSFVVESLTETNRIAVENGRIRISESNCPDEACIRQGWIAGGNTPIVCLPHRLIIKLETATAPDIDAIAR